MPEIFSLLLISIINGATICSLSCLHYIGPVLISSGNGFKDGVISSYAYLSGKIISYSVLGGVAAIMGNLLEKNIDVTGKYVMGGSLIAMGLAIPFFNQNHCSKRKITKKRVSLFTIGISTSLIPCPALGSMFLLAAKDGRPAMGVIYGLVYGMGLMLSPLVLAGGGMALISKKIHLDVKEFIPYLKGISMVVILILGVKTLLA